MICAIHQIQFMPGLRFFSKMAASDIFIYLDDVQYEKREFQNRNRIKTVSGVEYLTVPVLSRGRFLQSISSVEISEPEKMAQEHIKKIKFNYSKAPFFKLYFPELERIYLYPKKKLAELSIELIDFFRKALKIDVPFRFSSEFALKSSSSLRLAELCYLVKADSYLSGSGGRNYLDEKPFSQRGIKVIWQSFDVKPYPQLYGNFEPNLSALDLLLNCGEKGRDYL